MRMTVFFLGHSLVEFFDWQRRFPEHRVFNLGQAGESTLGLLSRTGDVISSNPPPDYVFIMTGTNDIAMEDFEIIEPYEKIVTKLSEAFPMAVVYACSILPLKLDWVPLDAIIKLNKSIKTLADKAGAKYLDLYSLFVDAEGDMNETLLMEDGVHLSDEGYRVWANAVEQVFKK